MSRRDFTAWAMVFFAVIWFLQGEHEMSVTNAVGAGVLWGSE